MSAVDPPKVIGLDLSLTSTGIAYGNGSWERIRPGKLRGMERLGKLVSEVLWALEAGPPGPPRLVVIEGYTYATTNSAHVLGELGGIVRWELHRLKVPYAVVAPSKLKTYATGKGTGKKTAMVVAARERLGLDVMEDDEADAIWLRALGLDLLDAPMAALPKTHRRALDDVELPT